MSTLRSQAKAKGYLVNGTLKRVSDDVFEQDGERIVHKRYVDSDGVVYAVDWRGLLVYIAGEDWCM